MCQLTGFAADFEGTCTDYKLDGTVTDTIKIRTKDRPFVPLFDPVPDPEVIEARKKVRRYQSFLYALTGGLLITAAASAGWASGPAGRKTGASEARVTTMRDEKTASGSGTTSPGSYLRGMKEGLWKYYDENGSLKYSIHYIISTYPSGSGTNACIYLTSNTLQRRSHLDAHRRCLFNKPVCLSSEVVGLWKGFDLITIIP